MQLDTRRLEMQRAKKEEFENAAVVGHESSCASTPTHMKLLEMLVEVSKTWLEDEEGPI